MNLIKKTIHALKNPDWEYFYKGIFIGIGLGLIAFAGTIFFLIGYLKS